MKLKIIKWENLIIEFSSKVTFSRDTEFIISVNWFDISNSCFADCYRFLLENYAFKLKK